MKAIEFTRYGDFETLKSIELDTPAPRPNEVLVKVRAVSMNSSDCEFFYGSPGYVRVTGPFRPKFKVLGSDIAGVVERVGERVTKFRKGESVFGDSFGAWGGLAEYVVVQEDMLVSKPSAISFEEASSIPQAGVVALQAIKYMGNIHPNQRLLINGAGGGAGSFAIQLAKLAGANVTAVDNEYKLNFTRSLGADASFDYKRYNYTRSEEKYQKIIDFPGAYGVWENLRCLGRSGVYGMVGGHTGRILQTALFGPLISILSSVKMGIVLHRQNASDIQHITNMVLDKKLNIAIDKVFPFEEAGGAIKRVREGKALGKVVVSLA